jgi:very-short-patch-repair endonuclease
MDFATVNKAKLLAGYNDQKKSASQLAKEFGVGESRMRRALKYLGVEMRSYSEAQKIALESGNAEHPTKGKKLSKETIDKISESQSKCWREFSEEEMDAYRKLKKEQWANMTDSAKAELQRKAHIAIRESSEIGSKTERYVSGRLEEEGYGVIVHARNLLNQALEVDMFIPELRTAIEIDGPSHFMNIWGEEKLRKQQSADAQKEGLLLKNGFVLIRVRQLDKTVSAKKMKDIYEIVLAKLREIEEAFPPEGKRLIELEVLGGVKLL